MRFPCLANLLLLLSLLCLSSDARFLVLLFLPRRLVRFPCLANLLLLLSLRRHLRFLCTALLKCRLSGRLRALNLSLLGRLLCFFGRLVRPLCGFANLLLFFLLLLSAFALRHSHCLSLCQE